MAEIATDRDSAADLRRPHPASLRCVYACLLGMLSRDMVKKLAMASSQLNQLTLFGTPAIAPEAKRRRVCTAE